MKIQNAILAGLCLTLFFLISPAYGEVMSLHTDKLSYFKGEKIIFSGTIESADIGKQVYVEITGPQGNYINTYDNQSDTNSSFQIVLDTNNTQIQSKFSTKGTYAAVAFIQTRSLSYAIKFDYSTEVPVSRPVFMTHLQNMTQSNLQKPTPTSNQISNLSNGQTSSNENKLEIVIKNQNSNTITNFNQKELAPNTKTQQPMPRQPTNPNSSDKCQNLSGDQLQKCLDYQMWSVDVPAYQAQQAQQQVCLHYNPDGSCQSSMNAQDYSRDLEAQQSASNFSTIILTVLLIIVIAIIAVAVSRRNRVKTIVEKKGKTNQHKDIRQSENDKEWKGI